MASCSPVCIQRSPAIWHALTLARPNRHAQQFRAVQQLGARPDIIARQLTFYRDAPGFPGKRAIDARLCTTLGRQSDSNDLPRPWRLCNLPPDAWPGAFDRMSCVSGEDAIV